MLSKYQRSMAKITIGGRNPMVMTTFTATNSLDHDIYFITSKQRK
jgi:hypothetical protein